MTFAGQQVEYAEDVINICLRNKEFVDTYCKANNVTELRGKAMADFELYCFQTFFLPLVESNRAPAYISDWSSKDDAPIFTITCPV